MTTGSFARQFCRSITSLPRQIVPTIALGTALLLLNCLTGLGSPVQAQEFNSQSTTTGSRIYHTRFRLGPGEGIQKVTIEGALRFSPDETKIEWIDDEAYLSIITQEQGQKLRFDAKANEQGLPAIGYKVDGQSRPFDEEAANYLADLLPVVFRELGHDEIYRVQTAYDQDGAAGVFRMISEIRSQYSVGLHVREFLRLEGLSDDEIAECFSFLGNHIKSDDELASILYQTTDLYREHPGIRHAYLECLNKFQSDIERTRVTQNLFGVDSISGDQQPALSMKSGCLKRLVWVQPLRPSRRTKLSRSC